MVCAGAFLVLFGQSASADELPPEPDASVAIEQLSSAETDTTFEDAGVAADPSEVSAEGESTSSAEPVSSDPEQSEPAVGGETSTDSEAPAAEADQTSDATSSGTETTVSCATTDELDPAVQMCESNPAGSGSSGNDDAPLTDQPVTDQPPANQVDGSASGVETAPSDPAIAPTTDTVVAANQTNAATAASADLTTPADPTASADVTVPAAEWHVDLSGVQTLSADDVWAWLSSSDSASPSVFRLLNQIATIVIRSTMAGSTLVVTGSVNRPVWFRGSGADRVVLDGPNSTVTFTGTGSGSATTTGTPITFDGVSQVGGTGATTYAAAGTAGIQTLAMDADDTFAVGSATSQLQVGNAQLAGTLRVLGAAAAAAAGSPFLTFGAVSGDFDSFRGIAQGGGAYLRPVVEAAGYSLRPAALPGGMTVTLAGSAAADDFFAYVSGKNTPVAAGTLIAVNLTGRQVTGDVTLGRSGAATTLDLTGAQLMLGDAAAPIATITAAGPVRLYLSDTGLTGTVTGALTVAVAGVVFDGTFTAALDTAAPTSLVGANAALVVGGVRISGVSLTVTAVRSATGWELRLSAPTGATMSIGSANQQLLIGSLLGALTLTLTAAGVQGSLPTATVSSAVPGVGVSGAFDGHFGTDGRLRLVSDAGTVSVGDTSVTGALELVPTMGNAAPSVAITGTDLDASAFGGLLVILGLTGGGWDLMRSGITGSASGAGTVSVDGVTGSASTTIAFDSDTLVGGAAALLDNQPTSTASRGPPVAIQLTNLRLTPNASPTSATITTADQITGLISAAPAAWQIALAPNTNHTVSVGTDLADIVVIVDGVTSRRTASQVTELSITASGTGTNTFAFLGAAIPVTYRGGAGIDRILGPAADTTWYVSGAGAGTVGALTFSGVEQLVGAADNQDLFVVGPAGSLALGVDGGARGFDTLRTDGAPGAVVPLVTYRPDGRDSGTITVGGTAIVFAGLEPVVNTGTPNAIVVTFDDPTDTLTVRTTATEIFVDSVKHEGFSSAIPLTSMTLNAGGATVRFLAVILPSTVTLTVNTAGSLTLEGTVTAGTIALYAVGSITVNDGQRVSATNGDLTLSVIASTNPTPTAVQPVVRDLVATGALTIGVNAILVGNNVTLSVDASTVRFARYYIDQIKLAASTNGLTPAMTRGSYPTFTPGANEQVPGTITRQTGNWITEGFTADSFIRVSNSRSNDGFWHVSAVTATTLTVDGVGAFNPEAGDSAVTIEAGYANSGNPGLTFASTTDGNGGVTSTITRSSGSWVDDGFEFGQSLLVLFTLNAINDGDYVVLAVTDNVLTVDAGPGLKNQGPVFNTIVWAQGSPAGIPMTAADPTKQIGPRAVPLVFGTNGSQQGTITRGDGIGWAADLFAVGQLATIVPGTSDTGNGLANKGVYLIIAIDGATLTVANPLAVYSSATTEVIGLAAMSSGTQTPPVLQFSGGTITRGSQGGTWTSNGFLPGQAITVSQAQSINNNGVFRIDSISADGLTLTLRDLNGRLITFTSENTQSNAVDVVVTATTALQALALNFIVDSPSAQFVTRNRGVWTDDNFAVGDTVKITGQSTNAGMFTISSFSLDGRSMNLAKPTPFTLTEQQLFSFNVTVEGMLDLGDLTAGNLEQATSQELGQSAFFDLTSWLAQWLTQTATATLTIGDGTSIGALDKLTVTASATTNISTTTSSLIFGITKAVSNATATVTIGAATLTAGGEVEISSEVENTFSVATSISSGFNPNTVVGAFRLIPGPAITVTIGEAHSTSATTLAVGSLVQGESVTIGATNDNEFETSTNSVINGLAAANTGFAIGVTVATYTSSATVTVNGTVRAEGDLEISAESVNAKDDFNANTGVQATPYPNGGGGKVASLLNGFKGGNLFQLDGTSNASAITASAAVAVGSSTNTAAVTIGATAVLSSRGDLTVKSYAEDNFNLTALTWATLSQNPDSGGSFAKISLSGAVAVGSYTNTATTTIVAGATLNAAGTMTLDSQAIQPIQLRILDWIAAIKAGPTFEPEPGTSPPSDDPITNGQQVDASTTEKFAWVARQAGILKDWFFNTLLGPISPYTYFAIGEYVTSTTVEAVSGGSRTDQQGNEELTSFGATGTVMVLNIVNTASTVVGAGAALNTRPDGDFAVTAEDDQKVEITSTSSVEFVADAGIAALTDLLYFFKADGVKGKVGIGGTAQQITVTTSADAHVEDGVTIAAKGGVAVRSVDHSLFVVATQQLGEAEKVGVIGAYTLLKHTGTSLAYLEDTVEVDTGDTGNLTVDAGSDSLAVTVSGVMQRGGVVAVGAGVSINAFDITTRAFIGNADGSRSTAPPPADGVSLAVGGALTVTAHSKELLVAVGIAATVPSGGNEAAGNGQPAPAGANAALNNAGGQAGQGNSASFGFGLSASVSVNFISDFTQAYVDVPGTVNVGGALSITATTTTRAITVAAALLPVREPAKTEITLAGSFVWNEISGQKFGDSSTVGNRRITSAWLSALKVTATSVTVSATNTEFVVAVGAAIGLGATEADTSGRRRPDGYQPGRRGCGQPRPHGDGGSDPLRHDRRHDGRRDRQRITRPHAHLRGRRAAGAGHHRGRRRRAVQQGRRCRLRDR